jgi:hypothetical protein
MDCGDRIPMPIPENIMGEYYTFIRRNVQEYVRIYGGENGVTSIELVDECAASFDLRVEGYDRAGSNDVFYCISEYIYASLCETPGFTRVHTFLITDDYDIVDMIESYLSGGSYQVILPDSPEEHENEVYSVDVEFTYVFDYGKYYV